jgi:hypothetical protein
MAEVERTKSMAGMGLAVMTGNDKAQANYTGDT